MRCDTAFGSEDQPHFGEHVTIDGYGGNPDRLNDAALVKNALSDLCINLGMTALAVPTVLAAPDNRLRDPGGWSGFVVLAESHLSIHTFPKRRFLSSDAYTCRNGLGHQLVVDLLSTCFDLQEVEVNLIRRGLRYPRRNLVE